MEFSKAVHCMRLLIWGRDVQLLYIEFRTLWEKEEEIYEFHAVFLVLTRRSCQILNVLNQGKVVLRDK